MNTSALASLLAGSGALTRERVAEAQRRRAVYGGTLDTVLLEMGAVDERTLATYLGEATGLPAALPERLAAPDTNPAFPVADARRLLAVPLGRQGEEVELALHPEADRAAVTVFAAAFGITARALVVPEVRYHELMAVVYAEPLPARIAALLGRLLGGSKARQRARRPTLRPSPPRVDTGPVRRPRPSVEAAPLGTPPAPEAASEPDIDIVEEPAPPPSPPARAGEAGGALAAAQEGADMEALLAQAAAAEDEGEAARAIAALAELRATAAVPTLIDRINDRRRPVAEAARAALITLTRQDFGEGRRSWLGWWQKARARHRMEWLLDALAHKRPDLRMAAADELQAATGVYFGYHYDLPERDREEARRRWTDWWRSVGKARFEKGDL